MQKSFSRGVLTLFLVVALLFSATACSQSVSNRFNDGADRFAAGKQEENYNIPNSGALLARLIEDFSGSLEPPFSQKMGDDDYQDAKKRAEDDSATGETSPDGNQPAATIPVVENDDQLKRVFMDAYVPSAPRVHFQVANGYKVDFTGSLLNDIYRELQREDPIGVAGVSSWRYGVQGSEYIIEISYNIDPDKLNQIKAETPALVDKAIEEMDEQSTDHYTLICAVNDYLCDTVVYPDQEPYAPLTHTPYGAFQGDAVCEGYATAAKLMLNKLGIHCDIQVGVCTNGGGHAWNLVELDGQWYQLDVTWNDCGGRRTDYLLVTDEYMKVSRTWDESDYPRSATKPYTP